MVLFKVLRKVVDSESEQSDLSFRATSVSCGLSVFCEDDDDEDHNGRARAVMLKSKVSSNKSDIKILKDKIAELESLIENLKKEQGE